MGFEGGGKGGVGGEHVVPGECATTSQSRSFTGSSASSGEGSAAVCPSLSNVEKPFLSLAAIALPPTERDCSFNLALQSTKIHSGSNKPGLELIASTVCLMSLLVLFSCMNSCYLRNANIQYSCLQKLTCLRCLVVSSSCSKSRTAPDNE